MLIYQGVQDLFLQKKRGRHCSEIWIVWEVNHLNPNLCLEHTGELFHPKMKTYRNVVRPIERIFLKSTGVTVFLLAISTHFFLYVSFCA